MEWGRYMKILIIEDDLKKIQEINLIMNRLNVNNYEIAHNVKNALESIYMNNFDLIITSLKIPAYRDDALVRNDMGYRMLCELAYNQVSIPTIVFSKDNLYEEQIEYLKNLGCPFIDKTINIDELETSLDKYLNGQSKKRVINNERKNDRN